MVLIAMKLPASNSGIIGCFMTTLLAGLSFGQSRFRFAWRPGAASLRPRRPDRAGAIFIYTNRNIRLPMQNQAARLGFIDTGPFALPPRPQNEQEFREIPLSGLVGALELSDFA
jgi:hypothetical protein